MEPILHKTNTFYVNLPSLVLQFPVLEGFSNEYTFNILHSCKKVGVEGWLLDSIFMF